MALRQNTISVSLALNSADFLNGLNRIQAQARQSFNNLGGVIQNTVSSDVLRIAGWTSAFSIIQRAGEAAFTKIGDQIKQASDLQGNLLGQANSYQTLLGLTFEQSKKLATQANLAFEKAAVGLPNADFGRSLNAAVGDDILAAIYDPKNTEKSLARYSQILAGLQIGVGGTVGVNDGQSRALVQDILTGTYDKIKGSEAFTNNAGVSRKFDELIKSVGGEKGFNALSKSDRTTKILEPLSFQSPEYRSELLKSFAGQTALINNALFGSQGLFSFSRNLIAFLPESSLFDSITNATRELVTTFSVFAPIIKGIVDPLLIFFKAVIDGVTLVLTPLNFVLTKFGLLEPVLYAVSAAISTLLYAGAARAGVAAAVGAGSAVLPALGGAAAGFLATGGTLIGGGIAGIAGLIPTVIGGLGAIAAGVGGIITTIVGSPVLLTAAIVAGVAAVGYALYANWDTVKAWASGAGNFITEAFSGAWKNIKTGWGNLQKWFNTIGKNIGDSFQNVGEKIGEHLNRPIEAIKDVWLKVSGFFGGIGNFFTGGGSNSSSGDNTKPGFGDQQSKGSNNPFANFLRFISGGWLNFATGNTSMFDALMNEQKLMPIGASPVIANSSEMILNRGQQSELASALGRGSSRGSTAPNITLNVSVAKTTASADDIASTIKSTLNDWWSQAQGEYAY